MRIVDRLIANSLPVVPKPLVRHFADRYMAGETLDDALATVASLNRIGAVATVDVLGEFIHERSQALRTADEYVALLDAIAREGLDSTVSVKLSALGLEFDPDLALELVTRVVEVAAGHDNRVRIDMEHSGLTDGTLAVYRTLRERGHDNVGIVLQAYLRRTFDDVRALAHLTPSVRLVKGIYIEPPELAYTERALVNRNFLALLRELVDLGCRVAVATHDDALVGEARRLADERNLTPDMYEFQLLLGVKEQLRDRLIAAGHRVRIYTPYGEAWYGYSVRRLKENPSIAGYVARDVLRGFAGRA
ncbi:MAG TPA: proline dehydrogenase family protein [Gaiellales bacterium]|nr:proline dehydrogenase family protein [Gaiellales bacterium]